jgi:type I restriction enzyme S subunit
MNSNNPIKSDDGWLCCELGDFIGIGNGYSFKSSEFKDEGTPIIKIKNIRPPKISLEDVQFYNKPLDAKLKSYLVNKGDILISMTGSHINQIASAVGRVARYNSDKPALINQRVSKIYVKNGSSLDQTFLYYFISRKEIQYYLASNASGSANQANISPNLIKMLKIHLPPLSEQKIIGKILQVLDNKIELNNQMNRTLEEIGRAIFRYWFVHFEFPDEEGKTYKSGGGEMVASELGEIPRGWKVIENIAEICDLINYGYTQSASQENIGPKFLRVMDINKGDWINLETVPYCEIDEKQFSKYRLEKGDIVIARMADPGKVAIFESNIDAVFASYLIRIRLMNPISSYYLYYLMKSSYYQYYIGGASSGTVQSNLNAKGLTRGLPILLPDEKNIDAFNLIIKLLRSKLNENVKENQILSQIRDSLLPKLMSGKIRVNSIEVDAK